jgi:hypothetical protein
MPTEQPTHLVVATILESRAALESCVGHYGGSMEREYDLFEQFPNGDVLWRMTVIGHENAIQQLRELAATTYNEVRAVHLPTQAVVAVMNHAYLAGDGGRR